MLYNSGTPSLLSYTRFLVNDPSTAASQQWVDADVKNAINRAYLSLRQIAAQYDQGSGLKRAYDTGVDGTILYSAPADMNKLVSVEVSGNGSNLSTTGPSSADIIYTKPWPAEKAWQAYNSESLDTIKYHFVQDQQIGIVSPITATEAGTNSIRFLYEASTTELSGDTDEPDIPRPFHDLICRLAGIELKNARDMDVSNLWAAAYGRGQRDQSAQMTQFRWAMQDAMAMYEDEIATSGLIEQPRRTKTGMVVRS